MNKMTVVVVLALAFLVGCEEINKRQAEEISRQHLDTSYYEGDTGPGWVREVDWYHRSFLFENEWGTLVSLSPCKGSMSVWKGMHASIHFKIANYGDSNCFIGEAYVTVKHLPPDLKVP